MARWWFLACVLAAGVGLGAGLVIASRGGSDASSRPEVVRTPRANGSGARLPHSNEGASEPLGAGPASGGAPSRLPSGPGLLPAQDERQPAGAARDAQLAREVERLKKREADARQELEASRRQLEARENLEKSFAPREFDLRPEDWRKLGQQGTLKLRIPCPISPGDNLTKQQLDRLGLVPEDAPVVTAAFQHSADRVWAAMGPLCAQVLGTTPELAAARGPNMCRRLILREAAQNGTALPAFQRAAAYLAGDAPAPSQPSQVESLVLALAQEQEKLEQELAEYLGPLEADRLVFSEGLCFTEATHQLGTQNTVTAAPAGQ